MRKGKVISLGISHKNGNAIIKTGEKVTENDVHDFDNLIKNGHIKEEGKKEKPQNNGEVDLKKLNKDQLKEKCAELQIEVDEADTKAVLIEKIEAKLQS